MNKFHRRLAFIVTLLLLISGLVIYFTVDINTLANLTVFKPVGVLLALGSTSIGLLLDGTRLMHILGISGEKISLRQAMQVVFGNYFLALLTPGATGGAVAQMLFLKKFGVPTGKATAVILGKTLMTIAFLLLTTPFIFLYDSKIIPVLSDNAIIFTASALLLSTIGLWVIIKYHLFARLIVKIAKALPVHRGHQLLELFQEIKEATRLLKKSPLMMVLICLESGISLFFLYAILPCLMYGLGVDDADWLMVMGRMFFLNMLLYFTPTPGGSGVAEGGFVLLFKNLVPAGTVGILAVAWRIISEYLPFLIGLFYTVKLFGENFINKQTD
ncbi:MAG: lysylphosphatidylglycerol synthase transmembrane domain-containing protein [Selenomonadaceae bacterium]|nr:lysylphosphatidylglycerol synthase transmembrane domain-containing protein [Selenomonadaceae bacterium]